MTVAHSKTVDLPDMCRRADIPVAAVGRPEMVHGEWIKRGAIVIDVGINRIAIPEGGSQLVGDVHFESVVPVAGAITPVPGGVGPMTIACLLDNTLNAYSTRAAARHEALAGNRASAPTEPQGGCTVATSDGQAQWRRLRPCSRLYSRVFSRHAIRSPSPAPLATHGSMISSGARIAWRSTSRGSSPFAQVT